MKSSLQNNGGVTTGNNFFGNLYGIFYDLSTISSHEISASNFNFYDQNEFNGN